MLDPKEAEVSVRGESFSEVETLEVTDINSWDEVKEIGDIKIKFPYKVTIKDSKGTVVLDERTQKALSAKDWKKKFYIKTSANGQDFVAYTRDMSLLALAELKKASTGEDLPDKINLNKFVGFKFEGCVVRFGDNDPFIDWVGTFAHNNVPIPSLEDLTTDVDRTFAKIEAKPETKKGEATKGKGAAW